MGPEEAANVMLETFDKLALVYAGALNNGYSQKEAFRVLREAVVKSWDATPRSAANIARLVIHRMCLQQGWDSPYSQKDIKKITDLAFSR